MKKQAIVLFSILGSLTVHGQEVVSSGGEHFETANGVISYTVGEVVIETGSDGSNDLTQGFHQTNWNFAGLESFSDDLSAMVYPNPTSDVLNIEVSQFESINYQLFDATGRIVRNGNLSELVTQVQVGHLEPGSYNLQLSRNNETLKNFKLIKQY